MADAPQVDIIARPVGVNLTAPQTNPALELAQSLQGVNEALGPALEGYANVERAKQSAKANADALASSGQAFAEAVRSGKLQPTQNPWYIQAYEQKAAQVRAQGQVASLVSQSQTWAERSDPQAFAAKWQTEVGKLAEGYTGIDQSKGFRAAADPLTEQALNSNSEYNAQAIQLANVQNTTQLMAQRIEETYRANPKAAPADFYTAIQPLVDQWRATGGTDAQSNELVRGAFVAAGEHAGNADILDNLKFDRGGGKGAIYNMVGPNGDPYAGDIEMAKYRIDRMQEMAGMGAVHQLQAQQEKEGYDIQKWAYATHGFDLVQGKIPMDQLLQEAQQNGFSPAGFQAFMQLEARDLASNNTYASAQTRQYALSPQNQDTILRLRTEALKNGWSPKLESEVWEQVRNGMDENVADNILSKADGTSKYLRSEAKSDAREARAEANTSRAMRQQAARDFKQSLAESLGAADVALQSNRDKYLLNPANRLQAQRGATDAGNAWLKTHPDDFTGAQSASEDYLAGIIKQRRMRLQQRAGGSTLSGGNPRASH